MVVARRVVSKTVRDIKPKPGHVIIQYHRTRTKAVKETVTKLHYVTMKRFGDLIIHYHILNDDFSDLWIK